MYAVTLRRFIELQLYDLGDYLKVRVCLIIFSILSISFNIGSTFFSYPMKEDQDVSKYSRHLYWFSIYTYLIICDLMIFELSISSEFNQDQA